MSSQEPHGVISYDASSTRRTDYLYRVSLKCLIYNDKGQVLVVKETGRDWWDLPGGGMDHGESIKLAIAREMEEEVRLKGDFSYKVIDVEEPALLKSQDFWQIRLIFQVTPRHMVFSAGDDGDSIAFMDARRFKDSSVAAERRIYEYSLKGRLFHKPEKSL